MLKPEFRNEAAVPLLDAVHARSQLLLEVLQEVEGLRARRQQWIVETTKNVRSICGEVNRIAARIAPGVCLVLPPEPPSESDVVLGGSMTNEPRAFFPRNTTTTASDICPADLTRLLILNPIEFRTRRSLPDLEMAIRNLAPADLRSCPVDLFAIILPVLTGWLQIFDRANHAFALLHEGFCVFGDVALLQSNDARACANALVDAFLCPGAQHYAAAVGVSRERVQEVVQAIADCT